MSDLEPVLVLGLLLGVLGSGENRGVAPRLLLLPLLSRALDLLLPLPGRDVAARGERGR